MKEYALRQALSGTESVSYTHLRQSVTLLENRSGTLPLDPRRLRRVAVIGPNADNIYNQLCYRESVSEIRLYG